MPIQLCCAQVPTIHDVAQRSATVGWDAGFVAQAGNSHVRKQYGAEERETVREREEQAAGEA